MLPLVFVLSFSVGPRSEAPDPWFSADKVKHFFGAAFVQSMSYGTLRATGASHGASLTGATAATALVSIGKEVHDARGGGDPSARDLAWDAAGAGAASLLLTRTVR